MLYLFNSGYRSIYVRNVLNTLFVPRAGTNEYRYRFRSSAGSTDAINISTGSLDRIKGLHVGSKAVIVFVDRFSSGGYTYHPLRMAKFVTTREDNDYLFFRVQLEDYVYPRDIDDFNHHFRQHMHPKGIVQLIDNDPFNSNDGWYAVVDDSLFSRQDDFKTGNDAWIAAVENIQACAAFQEYPPVRNSDKLTPKRKPNDYIFMRCEFNDNAGRSLSPQLRKNRAVFELVRGKNYKLNLSYRYPRGSSLNRVGSNHFRTASG
ncbi:MAG: hypothetical protein Tsb0027_23480 [Wenzhouxiangellaceae bacterium]